MPDALNLRFPGQYYDDETGLHYNYFRDYEPGTGRYVQSDPMGIGPASSTYAYAASNPLLNFDPNGLLHLTDPAAAQGAAGGVDCQYGALKPFLVVPLPWSECAEIVECALKHEQTHISDFNLGQPICHWYNAFTQVVAYDSTIEMQKYELHAFNVEKECLERYLREGDCKNKDHCTSLIKMRIDQISNVFIPRVLDGSYGVR